MLLQQLYSTRYLSPLGAQHLSGAETRFRPLKWQNCVMARFMERAGLTRDAIVEKVKQPV